MNLASMGLLPFAALTLMTGCDSQSQKDKEEEKVVVCSLHDIPLSTANGYYPDPRIMGDPPWDLVRFMGEEQFPALLPWDFSDGRSEIQNVAGEVSFCSTCQREFESQFEAFRKLPEDEKEAHFDAMCLRILEKEKAEQDADGDSL